MQQIQTGSSVSTAKARRERLTQILDGRIDFAGINTEKSPLQVLAESATPQEVELKSTWPRSLALATILLIGLVVFQPVMELAWLIAGVTLVICAFVEAIAKFFLNTKLLRGWSQKLGAGLQELVEVHTLLNDYLLQLDKRTSKYFHCVTNTKVTTYCILKQVLGALEERITVTSRLLDRGSPASLVKAFWQLRELLPFRDGYLQNSGLEHFLAPCNIFPAVHLLIEELDESLVELEKEIKLDGRLKPLPQQH